MRGTNHYDRTFSRSAKRVPDAQPFWSPLALNPTVWLRADRGTTLNAAGVSNWLDISGNGMDAVQGVGASQPTFTPVGPGSVPALLFDGVADSMTTTLSGLGATVTAIVVTQRVSVTGSGRGWLSLNDGAGNDGTSAQMFTTFETPAGMTTINVFRNSVTLATAAHPGTGVNFLSAIRFDGTNNRMRTNAVVSDPQASSGTFAASNSLLLGARGFPIGVWTNVYISEVVFLKRSISDFELDSFANYCRMRQGIVA